MFSNSHFQFVYLVRLHGDACIWVIEKTCHLITTMNKQTEMNMTSSWETNLLSQHTQNHRSTDQCYVPSNAVICQEKKKAEDLLLGNSQTCWVVIFAATCECG